ncbi:hypothetical protein AZE42_02892 [Rhizopogon vesiculosus]|uniref:Uncharacterized protein n=1 Tax=Rhizopogon vesiculosus TaxID=180088 RepID=A0A1J8PVH4_9AGAM|nr:hypothetical protein AZE42_02892 [Rhizopogon vesiculosus]
MMVRTTALMLGLGIHRRTLKYLDWGQQVLQED